MSRWANGEDRGGPPQPGFFVMRLRPGAHLVPCEIAHGPSGWTGRINGVVLGPPVADPATSSWVNRIWHYATRVSVDEVRHLEALRAWAIRHQPDHPILSPLVRINRDTVAPVIP